MNRLKIFPIIGHGVFLFMMITFPSSVASQIHGPTEVCPQEQERYTLWGCNCTDYTWYVTNGQIVNGNTGSSIDVVWDSHKRSGKVEVYVSNCTECGDQQFGKNVQIHDFEHFIEIQTSPVNMSSVTCATSSLSFHLADPGNKLDLDIIGDITWFAPSGWTFQPSTTIGSTEYGEHSLNVVMYTNQELDGVKDVCVEFDDPCGGVITKCVSLTFPNANCQDYHYTAYPAHPTSHSKTSTIFNGTINLNQNNSYTYVSGGGVELLPDFEVEANPNLTFEAFIEDCSCQSPYFTPGPSHMTSNPLAAPNLEQDARTEKEDSEGGQLLSGNEPSSFLKIPPHPRDYEISIFPNPTSGTVFIETEKRDLVIEVFDSKSKLCYSGSLSSSEGFLDLDYLPAGIYFISIKTDSENPIIKKIIKR